MSDVLTVYTSFADISELSSGFADRVEENQIVLYGPTEYAEGDEITFRVLLADEAPGLEGAGIVTAVYDGGDERDPEIRYDVVIAGLRLEGLSEVVFERLLVARGSIAGDEPPSTRMPAISEEAHGFDQEATTVASLDELSEIASAEDVASVDEVVEEVVTSEVAIVETAPVAEPEPVFEAAPEPEPVFEAAPEPEPVFEAEPEPEPAPLFAEPPQKDSVRAARPAFAAVEVAPIADGGRNAGAAGEGYRGLPPPSAPPVPPGFSVQKGLAADQLGRPVLGSTWQPEARPREAQRASDGLFEYGGPIRLPLNPPRPEGVAGGIARAPAATTEEAYRASRQAAGYALPTPSANVAYGSAVAEDVVDAADAVDEVVDDFDVVGH